MDGIFGRARQKDYFGLIDDVLIKGQMISFHIQARSKLNRTFRSLFVFKLPRLFLALIFFAIDSGDLGYAAGQKIPDTKVSGSKPPLRKLNPNPKRAYEIRMKLENVSDISPADQGGARFATVEGTVQFDVSNAARCGKSRWLAGNVPVISSHEPFRLSAVSATEYVGIVYTDMILDEDYYGRGVCHWQLTEARLALKARDREDDTRFVAGLSGQKMRTDDKQQRYFWKGYYPNFEQGPFADYGIAQLSTVEKSKRDQYFAITMSARAVGP
ncbi:hypothetical protein FHS76_004474 [Ochrobactrum daejeonense]|uniref:Uncharacterized protein n=2 Tax=Brucella TaxID=234 RepID=A0A7W9B1J6_9HYPH|nr:MULTISPECIES: hypothetical protein [Brucella]MBB5704552.1 hypothetical protein [Brucella daejeonensis]MDH0126758.1 hypothetical protein [Brucella intermedia GD04153]NKB80136.1 hypothetical protein [Brucella daejeonensis]